MKNSVLKLLHETPSFLHRAGWTYHPPVYGEDGRFRQGFPEYDALLSVCKDFSDAGVKVFLSNLPVGWVGDGVYDFSSLDETLDRMFEALPDAKYIPRLRFDPPFEWMEKYPEELCVFENESTDPAHIRALVSSGNVNNTYDMTKPPQPNGVQPLRLDEPIGLQSFSSERWLKDALLALEAVLSHILSGRHASHFVGFHICFGGTCELLHWGNGGSRIGDFSEKHTEAFYRWAMEKYGSLGAIAAAWERPSLCRESFSVPPAAVRRRKGTSLASLYRMDGDGCYFRDYELFHSETVAKAILALAARAKEVAPAHAVGIFYGYECYGHEHLDEILSSPYIDYLSAPKPYDDPAPGGRGGSVARVASIMHKKLWIEELDNRPHTAWDPRKFASHINVAPAADLAESTTVLFREACKLWQDDASFWWMDQGDAKHRWYADEGLMRTVTDILRVHRAMQEMRPKDTVEVALIGDTAANLMGGIASVRRSMLTVGLPFHEYRVSDLASLSLSQYRLLIFTAPQRITKEWLDALRARLHPCCQILFVDLPGICADGLSLSRVEQITGIAVDFCETDRPAGAHSFSFADQKGGALRENGGLWLCIRPNELSEHLSLILRAAQIKRCIEVPAVVHGNSLVFGVFSLKEQGISSELILPEKGDWVEYFTKEEFLSAQSVPVTIGPRQARVFIRRELCEKTGIFQK